MPRVRFNFLNWRPDQDEFNTDGLQIADNVLHDVEGYKELLKQTAGAFSTGVSFNFPLSSVRAMRTVKIAGADTNLHCIVTDRATTSTMANIIIKEDVDALTSFTATPTLISAGAIRIESFSVGEIEQQGVATSKVVASLLSGGSTTISLTTDYVYTVTSF